MQLEPDAVVAVDQGAGEPVGVAGHDPVERLLQARAVGAVAVQRRPQVVQDRSGAAMDGDEALDHGPVVAGVGVVVERRIGHVVAPLPGGAGAEKVRVDAEEALVGRLDHLPHPAVQLLRHQGLVLLAADGRQGPTRQPELAVLHQPGHAQFVEQALDLAGGEPAGNRHRRRIGHALDPHDV